LARLLTINLFDAHSLIRGTPKEFSQCKIDMKTTKDNTPQRACCMLQNYWTNIHPKALFYFATLDGNPNIFVTTWSKN
jgi:hypothetical protein